MITITSERERLGAAMPLRVFWHAFARLDSGRLEPQVRYDLSPLNRHWIENQQEYETHDHEHYEVTMVVGGRGTLLTSTGAREIGPGSVHVTAPGEVHGFENLDGVDLLVCSYIGEWLLNGVDELLTVPGILPLFLWRAVYEVNTRPVVPEWCIDDATMARCCRELVDIAVEGARENPSLMYLKSSFKRLMVHLVRSFEQTGRQSELVLDEVLREALLNIERSIVECTPFQVGQTAETCGMSPNSFAALFKRAFGVSPMNYYQRRRIQRGSWLLLQSRFTVTEIALQLGYTDTAHFNHMFKRERGMTPLEYRRGNGVEPCHHSEAKVENL